MILSRSYKLVSIKCQVLNAIKTKSCNPINYFQMLSRLSMFSKPEELDKSGQSSKITNWYIGPNPED